MVWIRIQAMFSWGGLTVLPGSVVKKNSPFKNKRGISLLRVLLISYCAKIRVKAGSMVFKG